MAQPDRRSGPHGLGVWVGATYSQDHSGQQGWDRGRLVGREVEPRGCRESDSHRRGDLREGGLEPRDLKCRPAALSPRVLLTLPPGNPPAATVACTSTNGSRVCCRKGDGLQTPAMTEPLTTPGRSAVDQREAPPAVPWALLPPPSLRTFTETVRKLMSNPNRMTSLCPPFPAPWWHESQTGGGRSSRRQAPVFGWAPVPIRHCTQRGGGARRALQGGPTIRQFCPSQAPIPMMASASSR